MYVDNNYLFIERGPIKPLFHDDGKVDHTFFDIGDYRYDMDDNYTEEDKNGYINMNLGMASAIFSHGRSSYGLLLNNRAIVKVTDMPYHFAKHIFGGFEYGPLLNQRFHHEEYFDTKILEWSSIGLHYGRRTKSKFKKIFSYGVNVKFLVGHSHLTFTVDEIDYTVLDSVYMVTHRLKGDVYNSTDENYFNPGIALDLGIGYSKLKHGGSEPAFALGTGYACEAPNYVYRFGLSIQDLGFIQFQNSYYRHVDSYSNRYIDRLRLKEIKSLDEMNMIIDQTYANDFQESGEAYKIQVPATLNLMADVQVYNNIYVNATAALHVTNRGPLTSEQYDIYVLSARYETAALELAFPMSMMDNRQLKPGFKLRIYGFTVGSDDFRWFFRD